jgi:hypothetical protein
MVEYLYGTGSGRPVHFWKQIRRLDLKLASLYLLLGIPVVLGAQELSRIEASRLIESVKEFGEANSMNLPRSYEACGERQGLWSAGQWAIGIGPRGKSFLKEVRYNLATGNLMVTALGTHKRSMGSILGISDAENGLKQADFSFYWEWVDVSPSLTKECLTMPAEFAAGVAFFKRYDDGWRLASIRLRE